MRIEAFNLLLSSVPWNLFGTLTVRGEDVSQARLELNVERWLRWVAHISGCKFRRLVYVVRYERGELGKRLHCHILIVVPEQRLTYFVVCAPYVSRAHREWGLGLTKFRRVGVENDPVVNYVLKETSGADSYEFSKTARGQHLVVSKGLWRISGLTSKGSTGTTGRMNPSRFHTGAVSTACVRARKSLASPFIDGGEDDVSPEACVPAEVATVSRAQVGI